MVQTTNKNTHETSRSLSIQISLSGFSFCIISQSIPRIEMISHHPLPSGETATSLLKHLDNALENHPDLQQNFKTVELIYENDLYTFVPKALFKPENQVAYLNYTIKTLETDFIAHDTLEQHEMVNVYIPFANINNYIFERFGTFEYYHLATLLVENLLHKEKNNKHTVVYAYLNADNFYLVILKNGKLLLCNTFRYENKEDFLYYLLFTTEQLGLNPETFALFLLGAVDQEHECYKIAYQYIRNIAFVDCKLAYEQKPTQLAAPHHKEFIFLNRL